MSKNLTRKGLALSAVVALGAAAFAGTPASAAELLTLAPSAGTTYNTLSTSTFTLAADFGTSIASGFSTLKYRVVNNDADNTLAYSLTDGRTNPDAAVKYGTSTAAAGTAASSTSITEADFVVTPGATPAQGQLNSLTIALSDQTATAAHSVNVTAWLDTNGNNTIDAGESTSPIRTVKFVPVADASGSVAIVAPLAGSATLKANVTLSDDINAQQVDAADVAVEFGTTDAATKINSYGVRASAADLASVAVVAGSAGATANATRAVFNTVTGNFEAVFTPLDIDAEASAAPIVTTALSVASGTTYTATLKFTNAVQNALVSVGVVSKTTVATLADLNVQVKAVSSATVKNTTTAVERLATNLVSVDSTLTTAWTVATGAGSAKTGANSGTISILAATNAAFPAAISSAAVTVTVTPTGIATGDGVTVNGKALSVPGGAVTFALTTGTDGKITFPWTATNGQAGDSFSVALAIAGRSSSAHPYVLTFAAPTYSIVNNADITGAGVTSIKSGDKYNVTYTLVDQWGSVVSDGYGYVSVTASNNSGRTTAAAFTATAPFVAGSATVALTDNGAGVGSYDITATPNKNNTAAAGSVSGTNVVSVKVVADLSPATVTLSKVTYGTAQQLDENGDGLYTGTNDVDNSAKLLLSTKTFSAYDSRLATSAQTAPEVTTASQVTVGATIKNAAGVAVAGTPVTIAAKGFLFKVGSSYVADSVTVLSDVDGKVSANVWSQVGGAQSIVFTAGVATATQKLTYAAGTASAKSYTFTGPTTVQAGRVAEFKAVVVDKFGNPAQGITVSFSSTGAGYVNSNSVVTDETGVASVKLVIGGQDSGTAVVSAKLTDLDGVVVVKTGTVEVGATDASVDIVANRVTAVASFSKGKTVAFYVDGIKKWSKTSASDADVVINYNLKKGTHTVAVKISGGFSTVEKFIVK
jgi:hypothetical protein